jgi:hypothetical protein
MKVIIGGDMTQSQITKLEKEIEKKVQVQAAPAKTRKDYRINLQRVNQLAQKIREYEAQPDAPTV